MMFVIDDTRLESNESFEIVRRAGRREISHVIHDIDGTHSLIRDWQPVMSRVLYEVISDGLPEGYDGEENLARICGVVGSEKLDETDRFCVESAGLSAITQMEWAIRRGIEEGKVKPEFTISSDTRRTNSEIIRQIWRGDEKFAFEEPAEMTGFLKEHTARLFMLYEKVLYRYCRDRNMAMAKSDPESWCVPGSIEFMKGLHEMGAVNYFVTGAVVQQNAAGKIEGGIAEEVESLGFEIGRGKTVEAIIGSTWDKKMPKNEVTKKLCRDLKLEAENVLIVGDGRTEIQVGVEIGAVTLSRLPTEAHRMRQIHRELGTNYIIPDYRTAGLYKLIPKLKAILKKKY